MIQLAKGLATATINPYGAWVTGLSLEDTPVLHPFTELNNADGESKKRGGMHVCLPNFGSGGDSGLMQHGFGRELEWNINAQKENSLELSLENAPEPYENLRATLQYELLLTSFSATLSVRNTGGQPLRVAPAFHPYFQLQDQETIVTVNGVQYQLDELAGTEFIEADSVTVVTASQHLTLSQSGLSTWAIWTDQLGPYACVEPTFGGYRFVSSPQDDEWLAPNSTRSYDFGINFSS